MLNPVTIANDLADIGAHKTPPVAGTGFNGTQTAQHGNSTSYTGAALANATAAYSTLGGRYGFAALGSAATDYALFAYLVPATHRLIIKGIAITAVVTGAANATTSSILDWSLAVNSTAIDLSTTDSGAVWAPRRLALGTQAIIAAGAIGTQFNPIVRNFKSALVCQPSRYVHVIVQVPLMTATASEVIVGDVMIDGYFESA